jgi:integrase/recombinase XerD
LKEVAERAGVNPDECGVHKFRKTYATLQHENGVSARTIQNRLGHSSLETTLAYLEAASVRSVETRQVIDDTFAVFA